MDYYILIFVGKIVEVTLATLRVVLIAKGEKKIGSVIAVFEIVLWLSIISEVLSNLEKEPIKAVIYATGFVIGNYIGSWLEDKIGLGTSQLQIISEREVGIEICDAIYTSGFAYTNVEGSGRLAKRLIIYTIIPRRAVNGLSTKIKNISSTAVVTMHETKRYAGGFGLKGKIK